MQPRSVRHRSRQHQYANPRITPELSRPAKRVRLERTVMRTKVNPKPAARNGVGRPGSTDKASVSTARVEASKDRSQERRQSASHEAILCRAARTRYVRSLLKRSRVMRPARMRQRPINAEASVGAESSTLPKPTTPTHLPTHNARIKPTREAGSAWMMGWTPPASPNGFEEPD